MPASPNHCETLILGGGLAGAAAAIALARAGHHVLLVERESTPKHKVCGEFLSAEALEMLEWLGIDTKAHGAPSLHRVRLASAHGVTETHLPFAAQSLTRLCLDSLLLEAAERAGATVLRGSAAESLVPAGNGRGWLTTLANGQQLHSSNVVLAAGKHDLRGFPRPHGTQGDLVAFKMYFRLSADQTAQLGDAVELLLHPNGYTGLQLVEGNLANLCGLIRRTALTSPRPLNQSKAKPTDPPTAHCPPPTKWPAFLHNLVSQNPHARQRLQDAEPLLAKPLALSAIPYGFVRRQALAETLYAVGDQAAVIPSFTGDGMSIALYTGLAAAQAILAGQPAPAFQRRLHHQLAPQVWRATQLSQTLISPSARNLLITGARLWPGGISLAASLTRLHPIAVQEVLTHP